VREVVLECDGVPVIFAHTTLSTAANGRLTRWMAALGSRSLGSLLFTYPGFRRGRHRISPPRPPAPAVSACRGARETG
jgi:chorismate-pyruvate lyase